MEEPSYREPLATDGEMESPEAFDSSLANADLVKIDWDTFYHGEGELQ